MSALKILYMTPFSGEQGTGAHLRSYSILRALREIARVEVVVLTEPESGSEVADDQDHQSVAYRLEVKPRASKSVAEKLRWTIDPRSNYPNGGSVSSEAVRKIMSSVDEFDVVWFFKLRSADAFPNRPWAHSVMDIDDVPSTYERAMLDVSKGVASRLSALRRINAWKRRERLLGDRFTVISVCSDDDAQYLESIGLKKPAHVIPNGFPRPAIEPLRSPSAEARLGFIGRFDYFPNRDAVSWFLDQCWPIVKNQVPKARLRLVGPGATGALGTLPPDVDQLGWLEDPSDEMKTWSAMIVPVRVGGGTRVKIAQGFSQKCPVVSTTLGAHGYGAIDGTDIYLGDSSGDFARGCIKALSDPASANQIAETAWRRFLENWTWESIRPRVWAAAEECLQLSRRSVQPLQ